MLFRSLSLVTVVKESTLYGRMATQAFFTLAVLEFDFEEFNRYVSNRLDEIMEALEDSENFCFVRHFYLVQLENSMNQKIFKLLTENLKQAFHLPKHQKIVFQSYHHQQQR